MSPNTGLRYLPETHEYFMGEVKVRNVTNILDSVGLISDYEKNEEYARFGNIFHDTLAKILCGKLVKVDERFKSEGWLAAISKFIIEQEPTPYINTAFGVERIMFSKKYGYAGTGDFFGTIKKYRNVLCPCDWKTWSLKNKTVVKKATLQLAAYDQLFIENEHYIGKRIPLIIWFKPWDYEIIDATDNRAWNVFLSALNVTKYMEAA
jgi:hypothetical protein